MNVVLDPVDTYLMLSGKDPNAAANLVFDMEYKVWLSKFSKKKKKSASKCQSVEYLYLTIAFWIWGALSCFSTNIHQYLTRKGWNKIDKLLYRNMFKEEEKSNLK